VEVQWGGAIFLYFGEQKCQVAITVTEKGTWQGFYDINTSPSYIKNYEVQTKISKIRMKT